MLGRMNLGCLLMLCLIEVCCCRLRCAPGRLTRWWHGDHLDFSSYNMKGDEVLCPAGLDNSSIFIM